MTRIFLVPNLLKSKLKLDIQNGIKLLSDKMSKFFIIFSILFLFSKINYAQVYTWNGNTGNKDFFDENNWEDTSTGAIPIAGSIDPFQDINLDLEVSCEVIANENIQLGNGTLQLVNTLLSASAITGGSISIGENAYLELSSELPLLNVSANFTSPNSWIKTTSILPSNFQSNFLDQIQINQVAAAYPINIRLDNYYSFGTIIRVNDNSVTPITIFEQDSLSGTAAAINIDQIHSGSNLPNNLNNNINSFLLKKGYMVTLASNEDGTGFSQVFIASEQDLVVHELPDNLKNDISFIRVLPWNWVEKRGTGGDVQGLDNTWFYRWNNQGDSDLLREYAPMSWGRGGADEPSDIDLYQSKYKATHVLAFNEPDDCNGQSGQYGNMCIPDTALFFYKNLMKTGLRLVSPACREEAWDDWLKTFYDKATDQNIRIDVIALHWYDWGGNPTNSPNANPQNVFNRFKNYLDDVYDLYGLPIWITEFNANKHRTTAVNLAFLELALPYLDTLHYVERYAFFPPNTGVAEYFDAFGNLTDVGEFYKNQISTPSIPELFWNVPNNLNQIPIGTSINSICGNDLTSITTDSQIEETHFTLFPNPVKDYINIISTSSKIGEIRIFDIRGKLEIKNINQNMIDVSSLPAGIYIIQLGSQVQKFIKI